MKHMGCAYFPEYWGTSRLDEDVRLMKEAGINTVRIGEFSWVNSEPREGKYQLEWLHDAVRKMMHYGIDVILCTPTATPPAWLTSKYPDTLLVTKEGKKAEHGRRRHYCHNSMNYRKFTTEIVRKLVEEFTGYKNVIAWQIDNELGPEYDICYCETCQLKFQQWLENRYGTIQSLNDSWKTGFWSNQFDRWEQIRMGYDSFYHYSSRNISTRRFYSETMIEYAQLQAEIIRAGHPQAIITTNGMGPIYHSIDYNCLYEQLDIAGDDLYFDIATMDLSVLAMNFFRSLKPGKPFWIMETGAGAMDNLGKPPLKGQLRAWLWSSFAHGAESYIIFRWRSCLSGQEQELQGILEHSGKPGHRYNNVRECFIEMQDIQKKIGELPLKTAMVAIVHDYDSLWNYEGSRLYREVNYQGDIFELHRKLYEKNISVDFINPASEFSSYSVILLRNQIYVSGSLAQKLDEYVRGGGLILAMGQLGLRDENGIYYTKEGPEGLQELLGITLSGGMFLNRRTGPEEGKYFPEYRSTAVHLEMTGNLGNQMISGLAQSWAADLKNRDAKVLFHYTGDMYEGQPSITWKEAGEGAVMYVGAGRLDDKLFEAVLGYVFKHAGIDFQNSLPIHVEVIKRGGYTFYINHLDEHVTLKKMPEGEPLFGELSNDTLKPYGVYIVKDCLQNITIKERG